jgi:hypothetical protein
MASPGMKALIPFAVFGVVIAVILVGLYIGHLYEQKRTKAFFDLSRELAFDFSPGGDPGYFDSMSALHLFSQGRNRRWSNLMRGEAGGLVVSIFDYKFTTGGGKHQHTTRQTVICFQFDEPSLPLFSLRPESFWHKVGGWMGMKDIDFDSHPRFSSAYFLQGPDEEAIRKVFTTTALDFFEQNTNLSVEAMGNRLFYYTPGIRVDAKKIHDFMARGFEILKQFRA